MPYVIPDGDTVDFGLVLDDQYQLVPPLEVSFPDLPPVLASRDTAVGLSGTGTLSPQSVLTGDGQLGVTASGTLSPKSVLASNADLGVAASGQLKPEYYFAQVAGMYCPPWGNAADFPEAEPGPCSGVIHFEGVGQLDCTASADLKLAVRLSGSAAIGAEAIGDFKAGVKLIGAGSSSIASIGHFKVGVRLDGAGLASLASSGDLKAGVRVEGRGSSALTGQGDFKVAVREIGHGTASLSSSGSDFKVAVCETGQGSLALIGVGEAKAGVRLTGVAAGSLTAAGDFKTGVRLDTQASGAITFGPASLKVAVGLQSASCTLVLDSAGEVVTTPIMRSVTASIALGATGAMAEPAVPDYPGWGIPQSYLGTAGIVGGVDGAGGGGQWPLSRSATDGSTGPFQQATPEQTTGAGPYTAPDSSPSVDNTFMDDLRQITVRQAGEQPAMIRSAMGTVQSQFPLHVIQSRAASIEPRHVNDTIAPGDAQVEDRRLYRGHVALRFRQDMTVSYWNRIAQAGGQNRPARPPYRPWLFDPLAVAMNALSGWSDPYLWPAQINFDGPAIPTWPSGPRMIDASIGRAPFRQARVAQPIGGRLVIPWGPVTVVYGGIKPPIFVTPIIIDDAFYIPIKWAYHMKHSVDLLLMPEMISCSVLSMSISFSMSSTAATLQAQIDGPGWSSALSSVSPRIVRAIIDGWTHDFVVDTWSESLSFGKTSLSLTGRAQSILLGDRFWLPTSAVQAEERWMSQLAAEAVADSGWTTVWGHTDWMVPGGLWSYTNLKPLQALARLASAAGGFLDCDPTDQIVRIKPIYADLPWDYGVVSDNLVIPEEAIASVNRSSSYEDVGNRVIIAGSDAGGVLVEATVRGTDGALQLPAISDPLMTHEDGARARAIRELAKAKAKPTIRTVTLPFDGTAGDFPFAELGWLVSVNYLGLTERGIVSANNLNVQRQGELGALSVKQAVTLGESQTNLYSKLRNLVDNHPLQLATVTAGTDGSGYATVAFPNGGVARLRVLAGVSVGAGQSVWVRRDTIEGVAPLALTSPIGITI